MPDLFGLVAVTLMLVSALTRLVSTWRAPSVSGVAPAFAWLAFVSNVGWVAYGVRLDVPEETWPSLLFGAVFVYILVRVHREGRRQLLAAAAWVPASVLLAAGIVLAPETVGFVPGLIGVASAVPQAVRVWTSRDRAGVAPWAWVTGLVLCLAWAGFGVVHDLPAVTVTNAIFAVLTVVVLAGYLRARPVPAS